MLERRIARAWREQHENTKRGWGFDRSDGDERLQRETATVMFARLRRLSQCLLQVGDELQGGGVVGALREHAAEMIERRLQAVQAGVSGAELPVNPGVLVKFVEKPVQ
jgi:hypothetical protein